MRKINRKQFDLMLILLGSPLYLVNMVWEEFLKLLDFIFTFILLRFINGEKNLCK